MGIVRVKDGLRNTTAEYAKDICLAMLDLVKQYMRTPPTHDDVTAMTLVRAVSS
jgi:hypothetical protein